LGTLGNTQEVVIHPSEHHSQLTRNAPGTGQAPEVVGSPEDMPVRVANTPGAIGILVEYFFLTSLEASDGPFGSRAFG